MKPLFVGLVTTVLVGGSVAGPVEGSIAQAKPGPVPLGSRPGCPEDNPSGSCHWCPGDPPVQTCNLRVNPVAWDANVCHTYWSVYSGAGQRRSKLLGGRDSAGPASASTAWPQLLSGPAVVSVIPSSAVWSARRIPDSMNEITKIRVSNVKIASADRRSPHWNGYSMPSIESTGTVSVTPKRRRAHRRRCRRARGATRYAGARETTAAVAMAESATARRP
jgi:hypothetical protein